MGKYYLTKDGSPLTFLSGEIDTVEKYLEENFTNKKIDWKKDFSIRIYEYEVSKKQNNQFEIIVKNINKNFKYIKNYEKNWEIFLKFKDDQKKYSAILFNKKGGSNKTIYVLWDILDEVTKRDCKKEADKNDNLEFKINHFGKLTSHAVLTLFFQEKNNCNKNWKYRELEKEMINKDSKWNFRNYEDRGLGGERPREWKKHMGYEWITNEKDRNVPDGSVKVLSPIPTKIRNERRNATSELNKEDWSELLNILNKNPKRLRCFFCGRFENETNRINEKTIFQKGHAKSLESGGDVSKDNIMSQCQYCNNTLNDFFDFDSQTFKMRPNPIKAIEKQNKKTRIEILDILLNKMLSYDDEEVHKVLENFIKKRK